MTTSRTSDPRQGGTPYFEPRGARIARTVTTIERDGGRVRVDDNGAVQLTDAGDVIADHSPRDGIAADGAAMTPSDPDTRDAEAAVSELSAAITAIGDLYGIPAAAALGGAPVYVSTTEWHQSNRLERIRRTLRLMAGKAEHYRSLADRNALEVERLTLELDRAQAFYDASEVAHSSAAIRAAAYEQEAAQQAVDANRLAAELDAVTAAWKNAAYLELDPGQIASRIREARRRARR